MKCALCNQPAERFIDKNLCLYHYNQVKPYGIIDQQELLKLKKCSFCGDIGKTVKHHSNYFPQQIIQICRHCHLKLHQGKKYPESQIFYKGVLE